MPSSPCEPNAPKFGMKGFYHQSNNLPGDGLNLKKFFLNNPNCSFESIEAATNEFQPFKASGPDGLYLVLVQQKGWKLTERILPCHFSSMLETQLCAIGIERRLRYISPQTQNGKLF